MDNVGNGMLQKKKLVIRKLEVLADRIAFFFFNFYNMPTVSRNAMLSSKSESSKTLLINLQDDQLNMAVFFWSLV